jgi:hypothetical protein
LEKIIIIAAIYSLISKTLVVKLSISIQTKKLFFYLSLKYLN